MKYFLTLILISTTIGISFSQNKGLTTISGVVIDSVTNNAVEFANVALVNLATNKPVDGTVCDVNGKFELTKVASGQYQLEISFIGYSTVRKDFVISDKGPVAFARITIKPVTRVLKEVEVLGQKSLVEEKVDRTIYNAEQDATTKGGDATDVLKRVPMLSVDADGNVSLRGSTSIKVLINNKPSTITASSVADALKQIPADMIKSVEVITSPSSKYDAEGSAGIINIILKKNTLEGIFLNVDGSAGSRGSNLSITTSYRRKKMGFSLGAFVRPVYNVIGSFENTQVTRSAGDDVNNIQADTVTNIQSASTRNDGLNSQYSFTWDYDIDKLNSLSSTARYGYRTQNTYQDQLYTQTFQRDSLPKYSLQNVSTTSLSHNLDASLNYTKSFTMKNREFNFMAIYSRTDQTSGYLIDNISVFDQEIIGRNKNYNPGYTQEVTLQADYQQPLSANQLLEFGAKDIIRTAASDYKTYTSNGSSENYLPSTAKGLSNSFNYNQSIASGYFSYTYSGGKGYSFKGGARYEYTSIAAHFINESNIAIPSYGVLVPSINLSRKLTNGNLIKVSYNRRIQRPSLQNLNPNLQASNRLNATQGNPYLKPEYSDNFEIAYNTFIKNATLNFSTYVRYNTNDIQQARSIRNDTIISIFQNIGSEGNYGLSIFLTIPITNNFSINGGTDMFYRILTNNSPDPFINATNRGLVRNYRVFGTYNFSKGWAFQFFSFFQGRNINLQGYRTNPISHSISLKKDLWGKAGSIGLGLDNFATPSYKVYSKLESPYLSQSTTNNLYNFIIKINLSYKIGKLAPDKKKKNLNDDEN